MRPPVLLIAVLVLALGAPASTQSGGTRRAGETVPSALVLALAGACGEAPPRGRLARAAARGAFWGGLAGMAAGIFVEVRFLPNPAWSESGAHGMVVGGMAGAGFLAPALVHLVNDRRGSLPISYVAMAVLALVGAWATFVLADVWYGWPAIAMFLAALVGQAVVAIRVEHATSRGRRGKAGTLP